MEVIREETNWWFQAMLAWLHLAHAVSYFGGIVYEWSCSLT